jgi:hypothetical protein
MRYVPDGILEDIVNISRNNKGEFLGKDKKEDKELTEVYFEFKDKREGLSFCDEVRERYKQNVIRIDYYYDWRYY